MAKTLGDIGNRVFVDAEQAIRISGSVSVGSVTISGPLPAGTNIIGKTYLTDGTNDVAVSAAGALTTLPATSFTPGDGKAFSDYGAVNTNANAGLQGIIPYLWNGASHDRAYGDITNGLWVNVKAQAPLPAGTNNIGSVNVAAIAAGSNLIGQVDINDISAGTQTNNVLVAPGGLFGVQSAQSGTWDINTLGSITGALPVGDNVIGRVKLTDGTTLVGVNPSGYLEVIVMGSLPAGSNNIGDVDVATLPALPAGTNVIGSVKLTDGTDEAAISATGELQVEVAQPLPAGTNNIGDVDVATLPSLPAGTNNIGDVDIASALPAGTNTIGNVGVGKTPDTVKTVRKDISASGENSILAAQASIKYRIISYTISVGGTATEVDLHFTATHSDTNTFGGGDFAANGGEHSDCGASGRGPVSGANEAIYANLSAANDVKVIVTYTEET